MHLPCRFVKAPSGAGDHEKLHAGFGSRLEVRGPKDTALLEKKLFEGGTNILGSCSKGNISAYWGEKSACLTEGEGRALKIVCREKFLDWICSAQFLDCSNVAILFAQNRVGRFHQQDGRLLEVETVYCDTKCTLFCGYFAGDSWTDLIAMSGTAFGEILIWKPADGPAVTKKLADHAGVIFDLAVSGDQEFLHSVSDDRALKCWHLADGECVATGYGHDARPWKVVAGRNGLLVTSGEDGVICLWKFTDHDLTLWKRLKTDTGSVRALDLSGDAQHLGMEGRIVRFQYFGSDGGCLGRVPLPRLFQTVSYNALDSSAVHYPIGHICFRPDKSVCTFSSDGTVQKEIGEHRLKPYGGSGDDFNINCATVSNEKGLACAGTVAGGLRVVDLNTLKSATVQLELKILNLHILQWSDPNLGILASSEGFATLLNHDRISGELNICQKFNLPNGRQRWTYAAVIIQQIFLLIGDRNGTVAIYRIPQTDSQAVQLSDCMDPFQIFLKIHGRHGVTGFHWDVKRKNLLSIGRDGCLREWSFTGALNLLRTTRLKFEWPARFLEAPNEPLKIAGFSAPTKLSSDENEDSAYQYQAKESLQNRFVIVDVESGWEFCSVECGGGRRSWDVSIEKSSSKLAFVKEGRPYVSHLYLWTIEVLKINAILSIGASPGGSSLAALGEDTVVTILSVGRQAAQPRYLKEHISSIHCGCTLEPGKRFISGGGRQELWNWTFDLGTGTWNSDGKLPVDSADLPTSADVRFVSVSALQFRNQLASFLVAALRSDGWILIFIDASERKELIGTFHPAKDRSAGLLSSLKLQHDESAERGGAGALLAGTDTSGAVHLWSLSLGRGSDSQLKVSPQKSLRLEKGGLSCIDLLEANGRSCIIAGGESGLVHLVEFSKDDGETSTTVLEAHASTVTDIALWPEGAGFVSVSTDQRVCFWDVETTEGGRLRPSLNRVEVTDVGDPLAVTAVREGSYDRCFVGGCGIEAFERLSDIPLS